ncbi:hypothetical protein Taro_049525 [Colocasia esculenta]|uniref:Uncharacterized protein n=1 Tax=Colocasia esculenta TaxID=4460 RepID=A0A843XB73_COLES|nr:hypothetical protein [Colocasia esculenta]
MVNVKASGSDEASAKPEKFFGQNFRRWQQRMKIWLSTLGLFSVIESDPPSTDEEEPARKAAELVDVCWLEIRGKIDCRLLSQNTNYVAYLIFKLKEDSRGLGYDGEASLKVGAHTSGGVVCLQPQQQRREEQWPIQRGRIPRRIHLPPAVLPLAPPAMLPLPVDMHPPPPPPDLEREPAREVPRARDDGWMEIKIGEFYNDKGDDGEVDMSFREIKGGHWKYGLIVEGIEVRPRR